MKKLTTVMLILVMVALVSVNTGCKKRSYDINGTWFFSIFIDGDVFEEQYTFVGSRYDGEVLYFGQPLGTYTVGGDNVNFTLTYYDEENDYTIETYSGFFEDHDFMQGNFTIFIEGYGTFAGTWEAYR
jgi:hypothetical protein